MAVIKPKRQSVIKKGTSYAYNPATFDAEHTMPNVYGVDTAEEVFKLITPFEYRGRKFLVLDTEDYALPIKSNDLGPNHVRRWVGKGKKAIPVDVPFCMSFCDGINMVTLYDSIENGFAEFQKIRVWLEDINIEKVFHNTKFDMHMLANVNFKIAGKLHDTVVLAKLANENRFSFMLRDIAGKLPGGIIKYEYMVDSYKRDFKVSDYRMIPRKLMDYYAGCDVWNCYLEFIHDYDVIVKEDAGVSDGMQKLEDLYNNEMDLMIGLWAMERFGMPVDKSQEIPLKAELQKLTDDAERAVYDEVGYVFNMNSNQQIHKALIHLGVDEKIFKKTDKGNVKLDKYELERLITVHNVTLLVKIQEYRTNEKLLGTYAIGLYDQMDAAGKVHASINQTEATTGRMSITKPALQTLPKRDKRIRGIFIPSEGFNLWFMDLDQVEYRGLAHYARAQGLIEAIIRGDDIHAATAALVFDKDILDVIEKERDDGKTVNFSLVYGQGDEATAAALKTSVHHAKLFKQKYFAAIPEVDPFIRTVHAVVRTRGFIRNWYGRRRRLTYNEAYKAPNALIQGWAADYIKTRLVIMYKYLMAHNYKSRLINVVHDEVIPEIHNTEQHIAPKLRYLLSDFDTFRVPITAGAEYSNESWGAKVDPGDIGFAELTEEEWANVNNFNVHDGSVFDLVRQ